MFNKKIIILTMIILALFAVSAVSANDNVTAEGENYNAVIIAEDMSEEYDPSGNDIMFNIQDLDGNPIEDGEPAVTYDNKKVRAGYDSQHHYSKNPGTYVLDVDPNAGNHKVKIELNTSKYLAKPVLMNVKIDKSPAKLSLKRYVTTTKEYAVLKATVKDAYGDKIYEGKVKFKVNGKTYNGNVKNGVATKKIKLKKAKTYTYTATFASKNFKTKSVSSKIHVYSSSKNARTFSLNGYKFTLSQYQYNKLISAKNTGKTVSYTIKTNKKVKQTIVNNYKNYRTINAFAYAYISYGGKEPQAQRQSPNKYSIFVETKYTAYVTKGKLILTKQATTIDGLKSAKVSDMSHFIMK